MQMLWPVDGDYPVGQLYWDDPNSPDNPWGYNPYATGHNGIDIEVPNGVSLLAPFAGTVIHFNDYPNGIGGRRGYGTNVQVYGTDEWSDYYCILAHGELGGFLTGNGADVIAGTPVLVSNNSGFSTGPHTHFGLRYRDTARWDTFMRGWIDPLPFLEGWAMTETEYQQAIALRDDIIRGLETRLTMVGPHLDAAVVGISEMKSATTQVSIDIERVRKLLDLNEPIT